jgi:hypothetical protein
VSKPIFEAVDNLATGGITVMALNALDFVIPGEWQNLVGFDNTIKAVTESDDPEYIQAIGERAVALYNDKSQGYQTAMWLYNTVDAGSSALGAAAMASKVGGSIPLLGFLNNITPKAETSQTIDLGVKLVAEIVAYCQINGIPGDSIGDFLAALADTYSKESLMRMSALICFDGLVPLGPDFIIKAFDGLTGMGPDELAGNKTFQGIKDVIPGGDTGGQLSFINQSFDSVRGWMSEFVESRGLSPEMVVGNLRNFIEVTDDKLDYLGAFIDMSTNYYSHTGTQTLARRLIERAVAEM